MKGLMHLQAGEVMCPKRPCMHQRGHACRSYMWGEKEKGVCGERMVG